MENDAGLELGLGLSIGGTLALNKGRILTARDFPSSTASPTMADCNSNIGSKRPSDSANADGNSPGHLVGWPPIRAFRVNSLVKPWRGEDARKNDNSKRAAKVEDGRAEKPANRGFVKVNMDGIPIGRKVDLASHCSYEALASTLEQMFLPNHQETNGGKESLLLNGSLGSVLTYQDKEGDWMLVGDVPWGLFNNSVKRLRIMRTPEAKGLGAEHSH